MCTYNYVGFITQNQSTRLKECGLTILETRRLKGDQIEVFKILNEYENIYRNIFFQSRKIVELEDMR